MLVSLPAWGYTTYMDSACSTWVDSVWFWEDTLCDDENVVEICYHLSSDCPGGGSAFVTLEGSLDSGATWVAAGSGWFSTLADTTGDLGAVEDGVHCIRWRLSDDLPGVEGCGSQFRVVMSTAPVDSYIYWLPYVVAYSSCASGLSNNLEVRGVYDSTAVTIDFDCDGVPDTSFILNENSAQSFPRSLISPGTRIVAQKPVEVRYHYRCSNYGLYEDGSLQYSLYPERLLGSDYAVPPADNTTILAIRDGTSVFVDYDYSGSIDTTIVLNRCETATISTASHAAHIFTNGNPIVVVNHFHASNFYSTTCAYELLPTTSLGTTYYAPSVHPYSLTVVSLNSRVEIVGTQNATNVTVNGSPYFINAGDLVTYVTEAEVTITADKPVEAVYISDITATDPWSSTNRRYMYSFQLFPEAFLSTHYVLPRAGSLSSHGSPRSRYAIASFSPANTVRADVSGDGSIDTSFTLGAGGIAYLTENYAPFRTNHISLFADHPVQVTYSYRGWWNHISESCHGRILNCFLYSAYEDTALGFGCIDSKPPDVYLFCPGDTTLSLGDTVFLTWTVADRFPKDDFFVLHIYGCGYDTTLTTSDTFYNWVASPDFIGCDTLWFVVSARDSFCNWGSDSCRIPPVCREAWANIACIPCGSFTSCAGQTASFVVTDLDGIDIDTMRVYATILVFHPDSTADTVRLSEPSDSVWFECLTSPGCSRVLIHLGGVTFSDGDSVVVSLDSLFNAAGCITIPGE